MAATATALLDWQPVFVLEKENYSLREENRHLHFQVHELMAWKEKALKQMISMGPKRARAQKDVQHATQLQRKLQAVEKTLQARSVLEESNQSLQQKERALEERLDQLEKLNYTLEMRVAEMAEREERTRVHVQSLADHFRGHLEQLVAIRECIDSEGGEGGGERGAVMPSVSEVEEVRGEQLHAKEEGGVEAEELLVDDPTVLIAGLSAVSDKCLRWFHQHVAQTFSKIQEKAALYEAQHVELQQLRSRVHSIRHDVEFSVAKEKQQTQQILKFEHDRTQLEMEIQKLRAISAQQVRGHSQMSDHVRLLVTEVRQYLRLVRGEIKKKFGYVPEAITHADSWSRILDAMDVLERQLRITTR